MMYHAIQEPATHKDWPSMPHGDILSKCTVIYYTLLVS